MIVLSVALAAAVQTRDAAGADDPSLPKEPRFTLKDHKDVAWCVMFAPDGKSMITCSGNRDASAGEIQKYDISTGKPVPAFVAEEGHDVRWLCFAPDGKTFATAEYDGKVRIRDAKAGKAGVEFEAHQWGVQCLKFTGDRKTLVTCGRDGTAKVWDVVTRKLSSAGPMPACSSCGTWQGGSNATRSRPTTRASARSLFPPTAS